MAKDNCEFPFQKTSSSGKRRHKLTPEGKLLLKKKENEKLSDCLYLWLGLGEAAVLFIMNYLALSDFKILYLYNFDKDKFKTLKNMFVFLTRFSISTSLICLFQSFMEQC